MRYFKPPGVVNIYGDGVLPFIRPSVRTDLTVVALEPYFVRRVAEETASRSLQPISGKLGIVDHSLAGLIRLLADESESGGKSGALYADHLTYALALRLLSLEGGKEIEPTSKHVLDQTTLRRILDRMEVTWPRT
jgi:hypothetical protein